MVIILDKTIDQIYIFKEDLDMSKNNNRDYNDRNQTAQTAEENREPYTIEVEPQNFELRALGLTDNMKASELCDIVNGIFRPAFEDYEGSKFIVDPQYGNCYIELWFNHRIQEDENTITGFSQNADSGKFKNRTLQRVMTQDRLYREGNSFHITQEGKDAISKFILPRFKNKNGKVNWEVLCRDSAQPTNNFGTNYREVLSCISGISPVEILKAQYGVQNSKGSNVQYEVRVLNSIPTVIGATPDFLLSIIQVDETQLDRALRNAGMTNPNGLGIVK